MTEAARESMTSDASQTSSLAWKQEDARSLQCNFYAINPVFQIFFKWSANLAVVDQNLTFKLKKLPLQHFLPGRVAGAAAPGKLETLHCSQQPLIVLLVPHQGQNMPSPLFNDVFNESSV